jgi:hypothetical protein
MAAPLPPHLAPATDQETAPAGPSAAAGGAPDASALDDIDFGGFLFDGVPPKLPDGAPDTEALAWWAGGLLNAVVAADASEDGDPILAAAGHAATAALLLLQHHATGDGDRSRLREACAVSADQVAIVRELLQHRSPAGAPAPQPAAAPIQRLHPADPGTARVARSQRRRGLRLVLGSR